MPQLNQLQLFMILDSTGGGFPWVSSEWQERTGMKIAPWDTDGDYKACKWDKHENALVREFFQK